MEPIIESHSMETPKRYTLESLENIGNLLKFASEEFREDREIVMAAVMQNGLSLEYASEELREDREIVMAAVTQNGLALNYVPRDIIDREIALAAIEENGNALKYVPRKFAEDPEIALVIQNLRERNQWIREREQHRQQREELSRKNASSAILTSIKIKPMHTLSATLHTIELHKRQLQKDEEKLRRREDELAEFQPTIVKMEQQKPERYDRNPLRDKPSYHKYREYLAEKNRIESNLEVVKRDIEFHKNRIMELEESIEEWDPEQSEERDAQMRERFLHDDKDIDTIHNGNIFDKATRRNSVSHHSRQKQELTPLQKLSNHGEGFRRTFVDLTKSFQGQPDAKKRMGYPEGGKTKKRYKYGTRRRNI